MAAAERATSAAAKLPRDQLRMARITAALVARQLDAEEAQLKLRLGAIAEERKRLDKITGKLTAVLDPKPPKATSKSTAKKKPAARTASRERGR